ncbi:MAG TPA: cytochrome c biogenesis protein CcsA [Planctomycetaceae bacterium]|nr:cytochrome c biogenesis protein CcsA [Planctomycetaceae bacterium]
MSNVSVFCFLASYFVTGLLEASRLWGKYTISRLVLKLFGLAGFVAHTWYLINRSQQTTLPPLLSSTHDWLLVLAWLTVLLYLFLTTIDRDLAIGMFLMPVVLALIGAAYFVGQVPNQLVSNNVLAQQARHGWALLHASLLVLGMAGGVIALVVGMMYLVQHHRLKQKQTMTEGVTLPSLGRLARMNWWSVMISVPLLTLGMAVGVGLGIWTLQGPAPLSFTDPVIVTYGVAWLVMIGFFVWLLTTKRPQDRQIASLTIWSFSFLLVSIVVLSIISSRLSISSHAATPKTTSAQSERA